MSRITPQKRVLCAALAALAGLVGCSATGPSEPGLEDMWVYGYYVSFPGAAAGRGWIECSVEVKDRSGGEPVEGLSVSCNGVELDFDGYAYIGEPGQYGPGETVRFRISDARNTIAQSLEVPDPPWGLTLQEGEWDFSDTLGSHTLSWHNPSEVSDTLMVSFFAPTMHPWIFISRSMRTAASATSLTIPKSEMQDFAAAVRIECAVAQARRVAIAGHHGESELWARAATTASWSARSVTERLR